MLTELFVTFHGIGPPPNHVSADERRYWIPELEFRKFIRGAKEAAASARVEIVATFDDGNRSDIDIAAPMLADCALPGIFYTAFAVTK